MINDNKRVLEHFNNLLDKTKENEKGEVSRQNIKYLVNKLEKYFTQTEQLQELASDYWLENETLHKIVEYLREQNKRYRERIEKLEAKNWELIEENQELKEQINQHIRFLDENHKGWENNWNFNALLNEKEKLHAENEELAVAYNNVQKEIYILKNKLESHRNTLKFYADETNCDAQYRLEIMRDSGDRARRELIN